VDNGAPELQKKYTHSVDERRFSMWVMFNLKIIGLFDSKCFC
jgi:hypothetical protein